jgi:hypothetical protein
VDPRLKNQVTAADLDSVLDLSLKTSRDITALHRAINEIRSTRGNLETLKKWIGEDAGAQEVLKAAETLNQHMTAVEEQLIQVNMKASEDNLRFPNRLNEQYDTFAHVIDSNDFRPTEPQYQVYQDLHGRLEAELAKWQAIAQQELPALNNAMRSQGLPQLKVEGRAAASGASSAAFR